MDNDILDMIKKVLEKNLDRKKYKFFLYGSRADGTYHFRSDYDIGVLGEEKVDIETKMNILEEFEKIPALIDFTDFATVSKDFKKIAMKNIIEL